VRRLSVSVLVSVSPPRVVNRAVVGLNPIRAFLRVPKDGYLMMPSLLLLAVTTKADAATAVYWRRSQPIASLAEVMVPWKLTERM